METIEYNGFVYPKFQSTGNAARFIKPMANEVLSGVGVDVGCSKMEWMFGYEDGNEESDWRRFNKAVTSDKDIFRHKIDNFKYVFPIEPVINGFDALRFPDGCENLDFVFSSHCLEHVDDWVSALDYWGERLISGGIIFLYLPHPSQEYWLPFANRKHKHYFYPEILEKYFKNRGYINVFASGCDANNSFSIIAQKNVDVSKFGIYLISNQYNGKKYIGSTTASFYERWRRHKSDLRSGIHMNSGMQEDYFKYGEDTFNYSIYQDMRFCDAESIRLIEAELIKSKLGQMCYNKHCNDASMLNPEDGEECYLLNLSGEVLGDFKSLAAAARNIGASKGMATWCAKKQSEGKFASIEGEFIIIKKSDLPAVKLNNPNTVYAKTESGNIAMKFKDGVMAGEYFGCSSEKIRVVIKSGLKIDGIHTLHRERLRKKNVNQGL